MKILADECCPGSVVAALRKEGHDVVYIAEEAASLSDSRILQWGLEEQRIILTEDRDFCELVFLNKMPTFGIVLMRFHPSHRQARVYRAQELFAEHADILPHTITTLTLTNMGCHMPTSGQRCMPPPGVQGRNTEIRFSGGSRELRGKILTSHRQGPTLSVMNEWTHFNGTRGMMMCSGPCQAGNEAPPWQRSRVPA